MLGDLGRLLFQLGFGRGSVAMSRAPDWREVT